MKEGPSRGVQSHLPDTHEDQSIKGPAAIAAVTPGEASFVHFVLTKTEPEQSSAEPVEDQDQNLKPPA